eukprot:TRINITY_DN3964_c0_g2_i1.p1 TRINITY_DN3964_c0_g2~~TRINITY_DN3964_c0_g2_i1.p1  ORF type:complete len:846 (+),score=280.12 TRINITY_DN3964_c0_g2_i1:141-2678(+)
MSFAFEEQTPAFQAQEAIAIVQKLLSQDESCRYAVEVKETIKNAKKKLRYLALIQNNSSQHEIALFVVRKRKTGWSIKDVLPVYSDMKVVKRGQLTFVFTYETQTEEHVYEVDTLDHINNLIPDVLVGIKTAQKEGYSFGSESHRWLKYYQEILQSEQGAQKSDRKSVMMPPAQLAALRYEGVKENWVANQMKTRESEYAEYKQMNIFFGTWNVAGKKPFESLDLWLNTDLVVPSPDLYVIAFQELDLSAENFLLNVSPLEALWEDKIVAALANLPVSYTLLAVKRLVGILLFIYVKEEHKPHISNLQTGLAAVGIMGVMGNKGGVSIRFNFYDTSVCIVNSHLAAHFDNVLRRNQDYSDISRRILFTNTEENMLYTIFDHDYLFWLGDLNYRITMADVEIRKAVNESNWKKLVEADQLYVQMQAKNAFDDFTEGQINFAPTYKYDLSTGQYTSAEKINRSPAYTDRILYRGDNIKQLTYRRHEMTTSDHKSVSSTMEIRIKKIDAAAKKRLHLEIVRQLDKLENESRPLGAMSKNALSFPGVKYLHSVSQYATFENTGKVIIKYRFIPKLEEQSYSKPWLWINPPAGMLMPGEKVDIKFTVHVDNSTVTDLNLGKEKIEDILILHLEGATDFFVTISGTFLRTCFGCPINYLVRFPNPIRTSEPVTANSDESLSIPKELWRILDYIFRKAMDTEHLFLKTGVQSEAELIRECLDAGDSFDVNNLSPHSMAETLLRLLESFPDPVIPSNIYAAVLEVTNYTQAKLIVSHIPQVNVNVFFYLMSFLRELLTHSKNGLQSDKLALVFSRVLVRPRNILAPHLAARNGKKCADFVELFLQPENDLNTQ